MAESTNRILRDILEAKGTTPPGDQVSTNYLVRGIAEADDITLPTEGPMSTNSILSLYTTATDSDVLVDDVPNN